MSTQAFFTRRVANPLLRFLLSSPLHGPLSSKLLVLTYTGRRSGQRQGLRLVGLGLIKRGAGGWAEL